MQRVAVIGRCGAGKSHFARRLGARTGLPVVHLDQLYWKPGWVESPRDEFVAVQDRTLPIGGRWIADGNYSATMDLRLGRADTVIFLDAPAHVCLARVLRRTITQLGRPRPDMAPGCPEELFRRDYPAFLWYVASYGLRRRPELLQRLAGVTPPRRVVRLSADGEISAFLSATGSLAR